MGQSDFLDCLMNYTYELLVFLAAQMVALDSWSIQLSKCLLSPVNRMYVDFQKLCNMFGFKE